MRIPVILSIILGVSLSFHCKKVQNRADRAPLQAFDRVCGLTLVAPPEPFPEDPFPPIKSVHANWISVIPYAFQEQNKAEVHFNEHGWQWWGERPEGVRATIQQAHAAGIHAMLKPQVYQHNGWTGVIGFGTEADWKIWEDTYTRYILFFAELAQQEQVELFCIGTEFNRAIQERPEFWHNLIRKIGLVYHGKLTYSANWDDWERVPFWKELDYIGLGGYFPLIEAETPAVSTLKTAWDPIKKRLAAFSKDQGKPILFTEYGYLSVDNCGWRNWELEQGIQSRRINEQAQANCYQAMFEAMQGENWWAGGFLWKWFPNMRGHEGYPERDYTPQGKQAERVLAHWYGEK